MCSSMFRLAYECKKPKAICNSDPGLTAQGTCLGFKASGLGLGGFRVTD